MPVNSEGLLLLGVVHNKRNVGPVKDILSENDLSGKTVFTEFDDRPEKSDHEFFKPVVKFLLAQGAVVLHEIGEVPLTKDAVAAYTPIFEEKYAQPLRQAAKYHADPEAHAKLLSEAQDELLKMIGRYRNPNILNLIIENNPYAAIMGDGHAEAIYRDLEEKLNGLVNYVKVT